MEDVLYSEFQNWTTPASEITDEKLARVTTILEIITTLICALAIFVNLCVLLVICIGPRAFRTPTFFCISSLATADMLTGISVVIAIYVPVGDQLWERVVLKGLAVVSFSASVNNLLVIAGDRYLKIQDESTYNAVFTRRNSVIFIALSWLFGFFLFLFAPLLGWSCQEDLCRCQLNGVCQCDMQICSRSFTPFTMTYLMFGVGYFYLSLFIMVALYAAIFISVRRRSGSTRKRQGSVVGKISRKGPFALIHRRREIKLAKTLSIVMGVFFICWLPVTTLFIIDFSTIKYAGHLETIFDYCLTSAVVHPLINPIIYSMRLPRMWQTFKHLAYAFGRRCCWTTSYSESVVDRKTSVASRRGLVSQDNLNWVCSTSNRGCLKINRGTPPSKTASTVTQRSTMTQITVASCSSGNESDEEVFQNSSNAVTGSNTNPFYPKTLNKSASLKGTEGENCMRFSFRGLSGKSEKLSSKQCTPSANVRLGNGVLVPRESVSISPPFNPVNKMSWN
ncbi:unnamed protein product [Clavelina lepadiformis]|uniref:G-protein coupled receptors family 1 profile domain-containing protein n=1 Tax=Clavelina lepadiformis TaxID=159417 RepID=A0ABP0FZP1_CLALP